MQHFHEVDTFFAFRESAWSRLKWQEYYLLLAMDPTLPFGSRMKAKWEWEWYSLERPYYRIYPSILRMFFGIRLDLPSNRIRPPLGAIGIQLPDCLVCDDDWVVNNLLVNTNSEHCQMSFVAYGLYHGVSATHMTAFPMTPETVERQLLVSMERPTLLGSVPGRSLMSAELQSRCMRIIATLCLIADNPEFVSADVLAADEEKYKLTGDDKYVRKAKRRGKYGWTVGKHVEMSPHFRNRCLALYWTGQGAPFPRFAGAKSPSSTGISCRKSRRDVWLRSRSRKRYRKRSYEQMTTRIIRRCNMTTHITLTAWRYWQAFRALLGDDITETEARAELLVLLAKARNYRPRDDMPEQWRARTKINGHRVMVDMTVQHDGNLTFVRTCVERDSPSRLKRLARWAELKRNEQDKSLGR